ncbi:DUF982 domain-containing protein [Rhizobium sp. Pop5]|uniref:DUF982 domain-containing protein n=1 Tax=Rhizobium sp. Pop5 TaxID=1223565 RepID=UPI0035BE715B
MISVQIQGVGRYRSAHTVADLAGMLISDDWLSQAGDPTFQRALVACLTALTDQSGGDRARKAFVAAARAAGIALLPDDAPDLIGSRMSKMPRRKGRTSNRPPDLHHPH